MIINLTKISAEMKITVPDLITRQMGRAFFERIQDKMKAMHEDETLLLDFEKVSVVDSSFIDELIIKLIRLSKISPSPFFIKLKNISEAVEINIDLVFDSYSSYNKDKMAVITEGICRNHAYFIGHLDEKERDILDYLRINKTATADEIGKFMGTSARELHRALEELYSMRLIRKSIQSQYFPV